MVLYKAGYYLLQYFKIKKLVLSRLEFHEKRSEVYLRHSHAKLLIATTYTSLTAKLMSDVICRGKSDLIARREFIALMDLYFLVVITDDFIDEGCDGDKVSKITNAFDNIMALIEDPKSHVNIKISPSFDSEIAYFVHEYIDLWSPDYAKDFISSIMKVKQAYIYEAKSGGCLQSSWRSLYRISRVTVTLYETINYFIYGRKISCNNVRNNLYNFAFSGNVIDDWMDYYWTKEDVGTICFLSNLSDYHKVNKKIGFKFNLITFVSSFYMLSKRLAKVRFLSMKQAQGSWIMPSFILVVVIASPISIWTHLNDSSPRKT